MATLAAANNPPAFTAAAGGGDAYANSGRERLYVKNGGGSPITVTITHQKQCDQGFTHNTAFVVTNAVDRVLPALDPIHYNDANGLVQITYSAVTSVTVAVMN